MAAPETTQSKEGKLFDKAVEKLRELCEDEEMKGKIEGDLQYMAEKYSLKTKEGKIFNDSIHGHIEMHPLLVKIIDTPQFQRLRKIKQLGGKYLVFPGASHNRFEHSIGVAYLAGCLVRSLRDKQPELNITVRHILCVEIAGLCHDLGHGPLSHLFDVQFIPKAAKIIEASLQNQQNVSGWTEDDLKTLQGWTHEDMSVKILRNIVETLKRENEYVLKEHGLVDADVEFIGNLIKGEKSSEDKLFLFEIVANKKNNIDVDRWDYFARDCHHLGISNSFDHQRLMKFARVCEVDGESHICFRDKEADNIFDMFRTRYTLHRQAYQHKTGNIIEKMFTKALIEADCDLPKDTSQAASPQVASSQDFAFKLSKSILPGNVDDYIKLTDEIFDKILASKSPKLEGAKTILNNIANRKLPKFVGEARVTEENMSKETMEENWKKRVIYCEYPLKDLDFEVYVVDLGYGIKGKDPFDHIYFYNKWEPNTAFKIKKYQVSSFQPKNFKEELFRVYCNVDENADTAVTLKYARKCFEEWCDSNFSSNIIFYERSNFKGDFYECVRDCQDLQVLLNGCQSVRVNSGTWIIYKNHEVVDERHVLKRGQYNDLQLWESLNTPDTWSCRMHTEIGM